MANDPSAYLETIARLEPDIAMIDSPTFYASAAISLKRIADSLEALKNIEQRRLHITENTGR